jgi:hypothetical protein
MSQVNPVEKDNEGRLSRSVTIAGIIAAAITWYAPKYAPIAALVPDIIENVVPPVSLLIAAIGRLRKKIQPITRF